MATVPTALNHLAKTGLNRNADPAEILLDVVKRIILSQPRVLAAPGKANVHFIQQRTRQEVCVPWAAT